MIVRREEKSGDVKPLSLVGFVPVEALCWFAMVWKCDIESGEADVCTTG